MEKIENEKCSFCRKKTLTLIEDEQDIPFFGKTFLFSMICSNCNYKKADVEAAERKEPCKITFEINSTKDMAIRVVKSCEATIKIPQLKLSVTPGPASEGYISNLEGIIYRFKKIIEDEREGVEYFFKYFKNKKWKSKFLKIVVKYINKEGSVLSAYLTRSIK